MVMLRHKIEQCFTAVNSVVLTVYTGHLQTATKSIMCMHACKGVYMCFITVCCMLYVYVHMWVYIICCMGQSMQNLCVCKYVCVSTTKWTWGACGKQCVHLGEVSKRWFVNSSLGLTLHTHEPDKDNTQTEAHAVTNVSTHLELHLSHTAWSHCTLQYNYTYVHCDRTDTSYWYTVHVHPPIAVSGLLHVHITH